MGPKRKDLGLLNESNGNVAHEVWFIYNSGCKFSLQDFQQTGRLHDLRIQSML